MERVFSSWKEIAQYLGKGVRTIQRWEHTLGLPVHRPAGSRVLLAYQTELDAWARGRKERRSDHGGHPRPREATRHAWAAGESEQAATIRWLGGRTHVLEEITARTQLQFLQTEIGVGLISARIALHSGRNAAERRLAIAKEAYRNAEKFLAKARLDEHTRKQLRRDLMQLRRAIEGALPKELVNSWGPN